MSGPPSSTASRRRARGPASGTTPGNVATTLRPIPTPRSRARRRRSGLLTAVLLTLVGCTQPVSHAVTNKVVTTVSTATSGTEPPPPAPFAITGAGFDLHTAGAVGTAAFNAAWAGVLSTLNRYLDAAVLTPLRSGGPAGDLAPLFTGPAAARVASPGPDRAAFIDEGLPPAVGIKPVSSVATLTALAGEDGVMSVISADLDLRIAAQVDGAPLTIARTGELVLVPEGGAWKIDAYSLTVRRDTAAATTSTTVRA